MEGLEDEEVYGDFEDLETGETFTGSTDAPKGQQAAGTAAGASSDEVTQSRVQNAIAKAMHKLQFDHGYDAKTLKEADEDGDGTGGGGGKKGRKRGLNGDSGDGAGGAAGEGGEGEEEEDEDEETKAYLAAVAQEKAAREARNATEFAEEGDIGRHRLEGYRNGLYVRVVLEAVPVEFVRHFRPQAPVVLGGLQQHESRLGLVRCRVKGHRWHKGRHTRESTHIRAHAWAHDRAHVHARTHTRACKPTHPPTHSLALTPTRPPAGVLKAQDPLVFSVGWRRFQSMPVYSMEDSEGKRNRHLKYTPQHMHCSAVFYGPMCPPNTPLIAFKTLSNKHKGFRACLNGVILELDHSFEVVKKLKLTGVPSKIHKNTAFIKGMFNSALEVSKFEGAKVKTVSGIRGAIKKSMNKDEPGSFRATFEDKILMSDIVICRLWVQVNPAKFYNPVTSLLGDGVASGPSKPEPTGGAAADADNEALEDGEDEDAAEEEEEEEEVDGLSEDEDEEDGEDGEDEDDEDEQEEEEEEEAAWSGMRSVAELRRAAQVPVPVNKDSLYKPVTRVKRKYVCGGVRMSMHVGMGAIWSVQSSVKPSTSHPRSTCITHYTSHPHIITRARAVGSTRSRRPRPWRPNSRSRPKPKT